MIEKIAKRCTFIKDSMQVNPSGTHYSPLLCTLGVMCDTSGGLTLEPVRSRRDKSGKLGPEPQSGRTTDVPLVPAAYQSRWKFESAQLCTGFLREGCIWRHRVYVKLQHYVRRATDEPEPHDVRGSGLLLECPCVPICPRRQGSRLREVHVFAKACRLT